MDALGVILMGAGSFLVYSAVKGQHPWSMFLDALRANSGNPAPTTRTVTL